MAIPIAISGAAFCSNCNHLPIEEVSEKGPHSRLNWQLALNSLTRVRVLFRIEVISSQGVGVWRLPWVPAA